MTALTVRTSIVSGKLYYLGTFVGIMWYLYSTCISFAHSQTHTHTHTHNRTPPHTTEHTHMHIHKHTCTNTHTYIFLKISKDTELKLYITTNLFCPVGWGRRIHCREVRPPPPRVFCSMRRNNLMVRFQ